MFPFESRQKNSSFVVANSNVAIKLFTCHINRLTTRNPDVLRFVLLLCFLFLLLVEVPEGPGDSFIGNVDDSFIGTIGTNANDSSSSDGGRTIKFGEFADAPGSKNCVS